MANVSLINAIDKACLEYLAANPLAIDPDRFGYLFLSDDDEHELREHGQYELIESYDNGWTYRGLQVYYSAKLKAGQIVCSKDRWVMRKKGKH